MSPLTTIPTDKRLKIFSGRLGEFEPLMETIQEEAEKKGLFNLHVRENTTGNPLATPPVLAFVKPNPPVLFYYSITRKTDEAEDVYARRVKEQEPSSASKRDVQEHNIREEQACALVRGLLSPSIKGIVKDYTTASSIIEWLRATYDKKTTDDQESVNIAYESCRMKTDEQMIEYHARFLAISKLRTAMGGTTETHAITRNRFLGGVGPHLKEKVAFIKHGKEYTIAECSKIAVDTSEQHTNLSCTNISIMSGFVSVLPGSGALYRFAHLGSLEEGPLQLYFAMMDDEHPKKDLLLRGNLRMAEDRVLPESIMFPNASKSS
jgi:hypothetical protein